MDGVLVGLLHALIVAADEHLDATHILHENVVLVRLDGTRVHGRAAVLEAVMARDQPRRMAVARELPDGVEVGLAVEGLAGRLVFHLRGRTEDDRLLEVRMEIPA